MKQFILSIYFSILLLNLYSQTYLISEHTSITTCSGTIYDSGGALYDCASNEHYVLTINSGNPVSAVQIEMLEGDIGDYDNLVIHDGPDVSSSSFDTEVFTDIWGKKFKSTGNCLTLEWTSQYGGSGFSIEVSCADLCIPYTNSITDTSNTSYVDIEYSNLCLGNSIDLNASSDFISNGNLSYTQTVQTTMYYWSVYNDNFEKVDSVSGMGLTDFTFSAEASGIFSVVLSSEDSNECSATNLPVFRIRVPYAPSFAETIIEAPPICQGTEIALSGHITPFVSDKTTDSYFINKCIEGCTLADQIFEFQISTSSDIKTIQQASDIASLEIKMEHSFLGDLDVYLICPDNRIAKIIDSFEGGSINLGFPIEEDECEPGIGIKYFWSDNASNCIYNSAQANSTAPSGIYLPSQSFDRLVGCPVNGTWKLLVKDFQCGDDGYIFSANLNLNDNYTDFFEFPTSTLTQWGPENINTSFWTGPNITENNHNYAISIPEIYGNNIPYTFSILDNFNCVHDTTFYVNILAHGDVECCPVVEPNICYISNSGHNRNTIRWKTSEVVFDSVFIFKEIDEEFIKIASERFLNYQYVDETETTHLEPSKYKISFLNKCSEETVLSNYHQNLCMKIASFNESEFRLTWNDYVGISYQDVNIFRGLSPDNLIYLTTLSSEQNAFTDQDLPAEFTFLYYQISFNYSDDCSGSKNDNFVLSNIATNNEAFYGIESENNDLSLEIFPNPASDYFVIEIPSLKSQIRITDLNGKEIIILDEYRGGPIKIDNLVSGIYLVNIQTEKNNIVKRLVIY